MPILPIIAVLSEIKFRLEIANNAVLIAPPGAGKTTVVPLALLNEPWLNGKRIILLEPRRLAAKNAATWMAHQLGEVVGQTVGYRMRLDTCVSHNTKIEVVTEGILTRIIQNDIALENYGLVIFDEFHERSLNADLGLALTLDVQRQLRDSLRILVMSATLDGEVVSRILDDATVIKSEGRGYPIDIRYSKHAGFKQVERSVASCVLDVLKNDNGSILVFLPGVAEIRRVYELLQKNCLNFDVSIYPLYSNLSQADQEKAIAPCVAGGRKIVLATSIAETSLTIDGVCVVIDAGLVRQPGFDPRNGLNVLETVRVSKASAEQRAGRAGRTEPGICYRLWTRAEQSGLIAQNQVEIKQADLSSVVLELALWGVAQPEKLSWIDEPPVPAFSQARNLLLSLNAIDNNGSVTEQGVRMMQLSLHPRLAHMVLKATQLGFGQLACDVAAILNERDYFRFGRGEFNVDLATRVSVLRQSYAEKVQIDRSIKQRVLKNANDLRKQLGLSHEVDQQQEYLGVVLAFAYPDRVAKRRKEGKRDISNTSRYLLSNGLGAQINAEEMLPADEYLVVADLRAANSNNQYHEARIFLAAEISGQQIEKYLVDSIEEIELIEWDNVTKAVLSQRVRRLGKLTLETKVLKQADEEKISLALLSGIKQAGIESLPWSNQAKLWQQRLLFLKQSRPDENWPDVSDDYLLKNLEHWLLPYLTGCSRLTHLQKINLMDVFGGLLSWEKQQSMDLLAPCRFKVPSGSQIAIDYQNFEAPVLAVRIQELFGLENTPTINDGRANLMLSLLSPARRPIQITRDLSNFWDNTYAEVKKDLKGRYPKHYWPDNPREAVATKRTKKHMR